MKIHTLILKTNLLLLLVLTFHLHAQTTFESLIVVAGDTTVLNIDNYTTGDIQWQTKDSLLGSWEDMPGAIQTSLIIPSGLISSEKYFRAVLFNGPNGKDYLTDARKVELRNNIADIQAGDKYAGGYVFLNQDSNLYVIGDSLFQALWGCHGIEIDGAQGMGIGDGLQNTLDIIQDCQEDSIAARIIYEAVFNGFDDWYLPSVGELLLAVNMLKSINQLPWHGYGAFLSSTEFDSIRIRVVRREGDFSTLEKDQVSNYGYYRSMASRIHSYSQYFVNSYHLSFKDLTETGQFYISFPDTNQSFVQVLFYDGLVRPNDQFFWDFQGGEIISGDSIGPYLLGYDFGGYLKFTLTQITQGGDTLNHESEPFRPQLFRKHPIELPRFYRGTFSTADVDNDGFEDFLLSGRDTTQLYRNINGVDFEPIPSILPNLENSFSDFGDFNNDGYPDLLIGGSNRTDSVYLTKVYRNMSGLGWEEQNVAIPGLILGFCEWTDFNRDGFADFIVSGITIDSVAFTGLYQGDGKGEFAEALTPFEHVAYGTGAFGDYNNDNFPDLVISGSRDAVRYARLYKNENGEFKETPVPILAVNNGSANWADYNNDGWLDFSVSGNKADIVMNPVPMQNSNDYNTINAVSFQHYLNLSVDSFKIFANGTLGNRFVKSAQAPADMDNDGFEDIVITGQTAIEAAVGGTGGGSSGPVEINDSRIVFYKNVSPDSTISFTDRKAYLPDYIHFDNKFGYIDAHQFRSVKLFDFNRDGRTDLLRGGATSEYPAALYSNIIYHQNTPPSAPTNLQSNILSCDSIYLFWDDATDDLTPQVALVYDLYIGTSPGTGDILSKANHEQLQNNWFRLYRSLEKGTYYWSVRARDGARIFGEWAEEGSFTIGVPTPTITFDGTQLTSDAAEGNQWYDASGPIPGATEPAYTPTMDGFYYCLVTNADGCQSDTSNVIEVILTGIEEKDNPGFRIYPNPTSGSFTIQGISGILEVQVYNLSGQLVHTQNSVDPTIVPVGDLAPGIYIVQVITKEDRHTGRLIRF